MAVVSSEEISGFINGGSVAVVSDALNTIVVGGSTSTGMPKNPFAFRLSHSTNQWRAVKLIPPANYFSKAQGAGGGGAGGGGSDTASEATTHHQQDLDPETIAQLWPPFEAGAPISSLIYRDQLFVLGGRVNGGAAAAGGGPRGSGGVVLESGGAGGGARLRLSGDDQHQQRRESRQTTFDDDVDWSSSNPNQNKASNNSRRSSSAAGHGAGGGAMTMHHNGALVVPLNGWRADGGPDRTVERLSRAPPLHEPVGGGGGGTVAGNNTSSSSSSMKRGGGQQQQQQQQVQDLAGFVGASAAFVCAKVEEIGLGAVPGTPLAVLDACCDEESGVAFLLCFGGGYASLADDPNYSHEEGGDGNKEDEDDEFPEQKYEDDFSDDSLTPSSSDDDYGVDESQCKRNGQLTTKKNISKKQQKRRKHPPPESREDSLGIYIVDMRNRACLTPYYPLSLPKNLPDADKIFAAAASSSNSSSSIAFDSSSRTLVFHTTASINAADKVYLLPLPPALLAREGDVIPATKNYSDRSNPFGSNGGAGGGADDDDAKKKHHQRKGRKLPAETFYPDEIEKMLAEDRLSNWIGLELRDAPFDAVSSKLHVRSSASQTVSSTMNQYLAGGQMRQQVDSGGAGDQKKQQQQQQNRPETAPSKAGTSSSSNPPSRALVPITSSARRGASPQTTSLDEPSSSSSQSSKPQQLVGLSIVSGDNTIRYEFDAKLVLDELISSNHADDSDQDDQNEAEDAGDAEKKKKEKQQQQQQQPPKEKILDGELLPPVKGSEVPGIVALRGLVDGDDDDDEGAASAEEAQGRINRLLSLNDGRLLFLFGTKCDDVKMLKPGEKEWTDFFAATYVAPAAHFTQTLTRLPKRLSPERGGAGSRPGTVGGGGGSRQQSGGGGGVDLPKVSVRHRNLETGPYGEPQPQRSGRAPRAPVPPSSRPATTASAASGGALVPASPRSVALPSSAGGAGAAAAAAKDAASSSNKNVPAHRSSLSRMMLRVQPTEEKLITRSRIKTLLRGGNLTDDALEDLVKNFANNNNGAAAQQNQSSSAAAAASGGGGGGIDAMLESGHDEPIRIDVAVEAQHPHTSSVSIEGHSLPVDVHVLSSYATDADDTTIVAHWLDAQRLISVQLVQHVRVGEGRKRQLREMQLQVKDQLQDVTRQRHELHDEKQQLLDLAQQLAERSAELDRKERNLDDREDEMDARLDDVEEKEEVLKQAEEAFAAEKRRHEELQAEHERRRRTEVEKQRTHERSMEAELRRQAILNDQLQRQAEQQRAAAGKLEKETEKINKERDQYKRDLGLLRDREALWSAEQRGLESQVNSLTHECHDRQKTIEGLHKQLKEVIKAEQGVRDELSTAVRIVEYFDGRMPSEMDPEWQRRKESRRQTEEAATKGVFFARTNMPSGNAPFQLHTNTGRSVVSHVRGAASAVQQDQVAASTQILPSVSLVTESGFSIKSGSYIEVEIGEGFCLGDVIFCNPALLVQAADGGGGGRAAASASSPVAGSNPGSFRGGKVGFAASASQSPPESASDAESNDDGYGGGGSSGGGAWFLTNSKGIRVAQCLFDPLRRNLDALRFTLNSTGSGDQTSSALETVLRSILFHAPSASFSGTRTVEVSVFVVSPRIMPPGGHCWMEIDVVVVDEPIVQEQRGKPFIERGNAVPVFGHYKPVNPFEGWMSEPEQLKFAEQHAFFGTKGYNVARLIDGETTSSAAASSSSIQNSKKGNINNNNKGVGFLGESQNSNNNDNQQNKQQQTIVGAGFGKLSEDDFFRNVTEELSTDAAAPAANNKNGGSRKKSQVLMSSTEAAAAIATDNLRRLSQPSLEQYLSKKGPLSVRRCPTCAQMRRLPRFIIHGKDKDVVHQYAVAAAGTASTTQHNSNVVKTSTGNAVTLLANAIEQAAAMPEQWVGATLTFTLAKEQPEDRLQLAESGIGEVKRAISAGDITCVTSKANDCITLKVATARGLPASQLVHLLHCVQFKSTASPLASAPRRITLAAEFPKLIIPISFNKTVEVGIVNAPYHVDVVTKRSAYSYYLHSVGIPDAKFDPAPLFFASEVCVSDKLGLRFEGKAQFKINSPCLRRDQLRVVAHPDIAESGIDIKIVELGPSSPRKSGAAGGGGGDEPVQRMTSFAKLPEDPFSGIQKLETTNSPSSTLSQDRRQSFSSSAARRKSKIVGRELDALFDSSGSIYANGEHVADFELTDLGCTLRYRFHRTTNVAIAQAVLRCVAFETVDQRVMNTTASSRRLCTAASRESDFARTITLTTALGRGQQQQADFRVSLRPGILVIARMGCIKWVEGQPPTLATAQLAMLDPKNTPQTFTLHVSICSGYEKGDTLEVRPVLRNARGTTVARPGKAGVPPLRLAGKDRNADVVSGMRLFDNVYYFKLNDDSLVFVFVTKEEARSAAARAGRRLTAAEEKKEKERADREERNKALLAADPFALLPHPKPDRIAKVLQNVVYTHSSKCPKSLKKVLRARSEDTNSIYSDCYLPVNVVPIDDPTDVNDVAERTLYVQGSYEAQRGLQLAPEATLDDPDTDDFVGGFLSIEPVGRVSVRDEVYILPVAEQVRRMLDGIVHVDDRNRVFVFGDEDEYLLYKEALAAATESGQQPGEEVTECCVGVVRRVGMPPQDAKGGYLIVDREQFVDGADDATALDAPHVAMQSGGEIVTRDGGGEHEGFRPTKLEFCFTPADARLIPLDDVQAVLRAIAFRNDSTRISLHRRHFMIRLGAGMVNIESNSFEDTVFASSSPLGGGAIGAGVSDSDAEGANAEEPEEEEVLKVADHTQVPLSLKVVPGLFHFPPISRHHRYVRNTPAVYAARSAMVLPVSRHIDLARATLVVRVCNEFDALRPPPQAPPNPQLVSAAMTLSKSMAQRKGSDGGAGAGGGGGGSPTGGGGGSVASPLERGASMRASFSTMADVFGGGEYISQLRGEQESLNFTPSKSSGLELSGSKLLGFQGSRNIASLVTVTPTTLMFQFENTMDAKHLQNILRNISYTCVSTNDGGKDSNASSSTAKLPNRSALLCFDLYDAFSYPKNPRYDEREDSEQDADPSEYPEPLPEELANEAERRRLEREERKRRRKEERRKKKAEEEEANSKTTAAATTPASITAAASVDTAPAEPQATGVFKDKSQNGNNNVKDDDDDDEEELDTPKEQPLHDDDDDDDGGESDMEGRATPPAKKVVESSSSDDDDDDDDKERPLRSSVFRYPALLSASVAIHVVDADVSKAISGHLGAAPTAGSPAVIPAGSSFGATTTTQVQLGALANAGVYVPTSIVVGASAGTEYPADSFYLSMSFMAPNPPAEFIAKSQPSPIFRFAALNFSCCDPHVSKPSAVILSPPSSLVVSLPQPHSGHLTVFEDPLLRCAKTDLRHNYKIAACAVEPEEISLVTDRAAHAAAAQPAGATGRLTKGEQEALDEEASFARAVRSACPFRTSSDQWEASKRSMSYANVLEAGDDDNCGGDGRGGGEPFLPQRGSDIKPQLAGGTVGARDGGQFVSGETRELRYRGYTVALFTPASKAGGPLRFDFLSCPAAVLLEILKRIHYVAGTKDKLRPGTRVNVGISLRLHPAVLDAQTASSTVIVSAPIVDDLPSTPIVFSYVEPAKPLAVVRVRNVSGFGGGNITADLECDGRQMHKITNKDYIVLQDANVQNIATFTIKRSKGNVDAGEVLMTSYQFPTPVVFGTFTVSPHSLHIALGPRSDRSFPPADIVQSFLRNCVIITSSEQYTEKVPTDASKLSKFLCNLNVEDGSGNTSSGHVLMQAALPKNYTKGAGPRMRKQ